jgi:hypothetical protein
MEVLSYIADGVGECAIEACGVRGSSGGAQGFRIV